jgi:uncharacterized protein YeaO (DUF488 family)
MSGVLKTARWNELGPAEGRVPDNTGFRLLVTRFRPRGVKKAAETWDAWMPELAPSAKLVEDFRKHDLPWDEYRERYLAEMEAQTYRIRGLAGRVASGETVTLLCSSTCFDESHCHRSLLAELVRSRMLPR